MIIKVTIGSFYEELIDDLNKFNRREMSGRLIYLALMGLEYLKQQEKIKHKIPPKKNNKSSKDPIKSKENIGESPPKQEEKNTTDSNKAEIIVSDNMNSEIKESKSINTQEIHEENEESFDDKKSSLRKMKF